MVEITPDDYIKMNEEFKREGTPIVLYPIPTQEEIDNPTGVKLPTTFEPQPPMDFDNPWPHGPRKTHKEIDDELNYDTYSK